MYQFNRKTYMDHDISSKQISDEGWGDITSCQQNRVVGGHKSGVLFVVRFPITAIAASNPCYALNHF